MPQPFLLYRKRNFLYSKNASQGCDPCGAEYALACPHGRAKSHKVTLCSFVGNSFPLILDGKNLGRYQMKYSGVGGQAVMEGVMMRNGDTYAVAVRKPDHEIEVKTDHYKGPGNEHILRKIPIIRGVISFVDSLYLGMSTLMFSASFFEDEEDDTKKGAAGKKGSGSGAAVKAENSEDAVAAEEKSGESAETADMENSKNPATEKKNNKSAAQKEKEDKLLMGGTVALSIVLALAIFFVLPYFLSGLFRKFITSDILIALIEGLIRFAIFIGYIYAISFMPDIKRVFMYHGAEHKCINCIEHGLELNVANVRKSSKEHKRCGTSFLLIVMLISIVFFMFVRVDSKILRLVIRLLLIPVIAGVSYEVIRFAGRYDNWFVNLISKPGLWMQRLTTSEPDDDMIEVGIASVEAVFDWKTWQKEQNL